jgi:hypothetical protein
MINFKVSHLASVVCACFGLFVATSSSAMTVTPGGITVAGQGMFSSVAGAITTNFNDSLNNPSGYTGGKVINGTANPGPHPGEGVTWAAPPNDGSNYFSVGPATTTEATINFGFTANYFGYYAGSPDAFNSLAFYMDNNLIQSFTGIELAAFASLSSNGNRSQSGFWNYFADNSSQYFNKVVFKSTSNSFESDNHAVAAVPVPAAAWLFGSALLGASALRRKQKVELAC